MKKILIICSIFIVLILFKLSQKPSAYSENNIGINPHSGYELCEEIDSEPIPVNSGVLKSVIPKAEFRVSGRILKIKSDSQDGVEKSITLVFGELSKNDVFDYISDNGALNKTFENGFKLNQEYFKKHVTAVYIIPANNNLSKAADSLSEGDAITIHGDLVYLETERGTVTTCTDPDVFKCKYAYVRQIDTQSSVYQ